MDTASSQPGDLVLPLPSEPVAAASGLAAGVEQALWVEAEGQSCGLSAVEFGVVLAAVGARLNFGLEDGVCADQLQRAAFFRSLRLADLALAHACALGREAAWERFLELYRAPLTQAAIAITGSATVGQDLADSLYSELFGLREREGLRQSPLSSYTGRGSLLGWLRATLAQRHVDHHRRTHRETPLEELDAPAPEPALVPVPAALASLTDAVAQTLTSLPAESRFLLAAYFLDQQTLAQIARTLNVHEATISRRVRRLVEDLRKQLLRCLQTRGLSKRAAEEALGTDPRDLEMNLRALLQTSQSGPFSEQTSAARSSGQR